MVSEKSRSWIWGIFLNLYLINTYKIHRSRGLQARQLGPMGRARGAGSPTDRRPPQNDLKG